MRIQGEHQLQYTGLDGEPVKLTDAQVDEIVATAIENSQGFPPDFTGVSVRNYPNGQKEWEKTCKDGKQHGWETRWYQNGQKKDEATYKAGKVHGLGIWWYENGKKRREGTWKDGKRHGLWTEWYEWGQKESERTWKDDELISAKRWDEDGNPR
jgi:antitoxin component YwqK of YwqJK toxin-antitoxin module